MKRHLLTAFFLIVSFTFPAAAADTNYVGIIPFYSPEKIWSLYTPFISYLNKSTGVPWELKLYHKHDDVLDGICSGEISIALLGPVPFGRAVEKCGVKPLVVALGPDKKPFYRSIIITYDPAAASLTAVKGRKFGLFEGSTAAHIVPLKMLEDAGITREMITPVFLKGQDKIMSALLKREIDAAGIKESLFGKFTGQGLKVLKISEPIPNFVFAASPHLGKIAGKQFVDTLLGLQPLSNPEQRPIVESWDDEIRNGFVLPPGTYLQEALGLAHLFKKYGK